MIPIEISGPMGTRRLSRRALVDTGADDTVFPRLFATQLGIPLRDDAGLEIRWRGQPYSLRFGDVEFRLTDGVTLWSWTAIVGFSDAPIRYPILGQRDFLEYLDASFRGADRVLTLVQNRSFPVP